MYKMHAVFFLALAFATLSSNQSFAVSTQEQPAAFHLAASDAIGYRLATIGDYTDYKLKLVFWGGAPDFTPASIAKFKSHLYEAGNVGTWISAKIGTRTEYKGFIDADPAHVEEAKSINLQGVPYLVPNVNPSELYKGHQPYWFCTSNDAFKHYIQNKLVGSADPKIVGLTLDDPEGSSVLTLNREGCYCSSCVLKFNKYLSRSYSSQQLNALGVSNLASFDIRQFHQRYATTPMSKRPLYKEYEAFQLEQMSTFFNEVVTGYQSLLKQEIVRAANISPYSWLAYYFKDYLDYFSSEVSEGAGEGTITSPLPVLGFKLSDAYGKLSAIMATGDDNFYLMREGRSTMLSAWIAEAYANGHYFMVPIEYYYYSKQEGRNGFFKPIDQDRFQALYAFIKNNAQAFDNLRSAAQFCIVIAPETVRNNRNQLEELVRSLSATNIPFDMVIPEIAANSRASLSGGYTHVLFMDNSKYSETDRARFLGLTAPKAVILNAASEANALRIVHNSPAQLSIVPRANSSKLVLHVLNKAYNNASDSMTIANNVTITIPKAYFSGKKLGAATYVSASDAERTALPSPTNLRVFNGAYNNASSVALANKVTATIPQFDFSGENPSATSYVPASGAAGAATPPPVNLTVKDTQDTVTITLPAVPFWCIVEFKLL